MDEINKEKIKNFIELAEKVLEKRKSVSITQFQDEVDKFFNCILQGKDIIPTFERRDCGISDEEWDTAKESFYNAIGKVYEK